METEQENRKVIIDCVEKINDIFSEAIKIYKETPEKLRGEVMEPLAEEWKKTAFDIMEFLENRLGYDKLSLRVRSFNSRVSADTMPFPDLGDSIRHKVLFKTGAIIGPRAELINNARPPVRED